MAARFSIARLHGFLVKVIFPTQHGYPAMAFDISPVENEQASSNCGDSEPSFLDDLMDSFLWGAVPKSRRSRERRATRKFGIHKVREYMTPKRNLVECLDCGLYHESHSICGNCYQKVRDETEAMKLKMDPETRLFNAPKAEVVYVYKGDDQGDRQKFEGKYIVEMDRPRPEWFSKTLLTKGHGKYGN